MKGRCGLTRTETEFLRVLYLIFEPGKENCKYEISCTCEETYLRAGERELNRLEGETKRISREVRGNEMGGSMRREKKE